MGMDVAEPDDEPITVRVFWSGDDKVPVQVANQFLISAGLPGRDGRPDGVYLAVGHAAPPVIYGTDQVRERLSAAGIPIEILGRYHLSRQRLGELIDVLTNVADKYDKLLTQGEASAE